MTLEFEGWYQRTRDEVVASVARAVADFDHAEDAVDEAFLRALERWDRVATLRSPNGWVYTVALNAARRTFRRRSTETRAVARRVRDERAPVPSDGLDDLLHSLPSRQAEAVRLRHVEGLTEHEIAHRMGVTRSTVSSALRAAHRTLAHRLRTETPNGEEMKLQLARVRGGHDDGCDVAYVDVDVTERVGFGAAVRDTVRVRRDDLVVVDVEADPPEIVWRWWHGTIESIDHDIAQVRRPVASAEGSAVKEVRLPDELRDAARESTSVWFGREDDRDDLVAVAVASRIEAARSRLPQVEAAYGP